MKNIITGLTILLAVNYCLAQKKGAQNMAGEYKYEIECLGVEGDGSQTVKSFGFGNSRNDAIEQAKKNAVRDVLFKGVRNGKQECNQRPVVGEVNARDKYEDYFNKFFTDGGPYKEFVSMNDEPIKITSRVTDRKKATNGVTYGLVLRILRPELKQKMITDNILKP